MERLSSNEGVRNSLRPYYIPPSIGPTQTSNASILPASAATSSKVAEGLSRPAVDFLSDLSYGDYLTDAAPSVTEILRLMVDQAAWKYTSVLLAHPFEVAKLALQVCDNETFGESESRVDEKEIEMYEDEEDAFANASHMTDSDSDPDAPSYFTSPTPSPTIRRVPTRRPRRKAQPVQTLSTKRGPHFLSLSSPALTAVISKLWQTSGVWGVWAGANTSFIHKFLSDSLEMFIRGLLVAMFDVPDVTAVAMIESQAAPWQSVTVAVAASALTALLTSPIDIVRTRLMLTPPNHPPRSLLSSLSALPSPIPPTSLWVPTVLHATLPTLLTASTPHFLRSTFKITPHTNSSAYGVLRATSSVLELGVRLPLETSLRRAQLALGFGDKGPGETIVPLGKYRGVGGTLWMIAMDEGWRRDGKVGKRKGQGLEGVVRGWRVGIWGLVGVWGAGMIGGSGSVQGGEF